MKRLLWVCSVLVLCGYGTNLSGRVTLADARASCRQAGDSPEIIDAGIILAEVVRDEGFTLADWIRTVVPTCDGDFNFDLCVACLTNIGAAVWP